MPHYIVRGSTVHISDNVDLDIRDTLPVRNYITEFDNFTKQFYLRELDSFTIPARLYGNATTVADRILKTFEHRKGSTGVLLTGEKGSGKTLVSKMISVNGATVGLPTIVVNSPYCGDEFNQFIQKITQPCIIFFDEFEKVYGRGEQQNSLLTLFDGIFASKKLFLLTCNDRYSVNTNMINRPGRLLYLLEYKGIEKEFVIEYCKENLNDQSQLHAILQMMTIFDSFNFDMLQALVAEMNFYKETPAEAFQYLNTKPEASKYSRYTPSLKIDGVLIDPERLPHLNEVQGSPIHQKDGFDFTLYPDPNDPRRNDDDYEAKYEDIHIPLSALSEINPDTGTVTFTLGNKVLIYTKKQYGQVSYMGYNL